MNPRNSAVPALILSACISMCACTTVDKFTIHNPSNESGEPASLEARPLALKSPCKYVAGADIQGILSPGPLQPDAIGTPVLSNPRMKETIYLIQVGDLQVQRAQGAYDITSFIGIRKNGAFV